MNEQLIFRRTEFCTNVIFFITYPVVMCINCSSICFLTYDNEKDDDHCFRSINKIVVAGHNSRKVFVQNAFNNKFQMS